MAKKDTDSAPENQINLGDAARPPSEPPAPPVAPKEDSEPKAAQSPEPQNGNSGPLTKADTAIERVDEGPERAINAFASGEGFAVAQRMAKALASSSLMPSAYQNNIPNTLIAIELASRIGCSVLMVAQSLDIIHGRPSWRAQFLIATVNACGRFTPMRFRFQGKEGTDDWGCRAWAADRATGEECVGPLITIALAKAEGWYARNGSKWKTLPELMLHYRSAAFWARIYAPELSLGMGTTEETIDTYGETVAEVPAGLQPGSTASLENAIRARN